MAIMMLTDGRTETGRLSFREEEMQEIELGSINLAETWRVPFAGNYSKIIANR